MPYKFVFNNQLLGVWMLMHQTYHSISRCEDKELSKLDISARQHAILMAIKYTDGPATPTQIAKWVDRNANSITLILDRMEKNGLVERVRNVNDRRSLYIDMTAKGEQVLRQGTEVGWSIIQDILGGFPEDEIKALAAAMEKLREKAVLRYYPEETWEEINVDQQQHLSRFLNEAMDSKP